MYNVQMIIGVTIIEKYHLIIKKRRYLIVSIQIQSFRCAPHSCKVIKLTKFSISYLVFI
jgi:hypothetical protein